MRVSVSKLDLYASWKQREDQSLADLVKMLTDNTPTEAMLRGRAFAKAVERAEVGESPYLVQDGYTFAFTGDFTVEHFPRREESREKDYGGIIVSSRCDRVLGNLIVDDKTTERFDAENYLESWQWKFYLDIFAADQFVWNAWEMNELDTPKAYGVHHLHRLHQYRYPALEADCTALAQEYRNFAERYL
jgi:hypothetical protein